jgi:hypothetical protein
LAGRVLLKIVYVLTCRILGLVVVLFRGDQATATEVLVLRHENAVLAGRSAGRSTSRRTGPASPRWHECWHVGVGPRCSPSRTRIMHTVGSAEEARRAVASGVDLVVAQGWEAGGHVWGAVATLPLVPAVVDAVAPVPVIAAGGIGDARGVAAVLALGAQAAWLGTRFLLAEEMPIHEEYRRRVIAAAETDPHGTPTYTRSDGRMLPTARSATQRPRRGRPAVGRRGVRSRRRAGLACQRS